MRGLSADNVIFPVICFVTLFSSLVSGAIYQYSAVVFSSSVFLCLLIVSLSRPVGVIIQMWPAWAVLAVCWLSSLWTVNLNFTLQNSFSLSSLVGFSLLAAYSAGGRKAGIILGVLFLSAVAVSVYGVYQYAIGLENTAYYVREYGVSDFGMSEGRVRSTLATLDYRRAFSTMMSPNVLAGFLAMALPVGLAKFLQTRTLHGRVLYASGLSVVLICTVLTKSVGGFIAMFAGAAVFAVALHIVSNETGSKSIRKVATGVAVVMLVACLAGAIVIKQRTGGLLGIENSVADRADYFRGAAEVFGGRPLTGFGAGSFQLTYLSRIERGDGASRYAHNLPLQTLAETGLIGFGALVVMFAAFFRRCIKGLKKGHENVLLYAALMAGGTAFLVHNMVDFTWYVRDTAFVWWLFFGLVSLPGGDSRDTGNQGIAAVVILMAVTLLFGFYYGKTVLAEKNRGEAANAVLDAGIPLRQAVTRGPVPSSAVEYAEKAVRLKPYDDMLRAFLGGLYEGSAYEKGPLYAGKAMREYEEAIRLNPLYPYHYRDLGILYMKLGDRESARRMFDEARRRYPADEKLSGYTATPEK